MARTKSLVGDCEIEWSELATIFVGTRAFNPFQMDSYVARVTLADGYVVFVALPPHARRLGRVAYVQAVVDAAKAAHDAGETAVAL